MRSNLTFLPQKSTPVPHTSLIDVASIYMYDHAILYPYYLTPEMPGTTERLGA